jgi:ABC-2 type transport system ATP-binding protein
MLRFNQNKRKGDKEMAIVIKNLTKKFKEHVAVDNLSLTIEKGEFFALLGQNAAGKTTTIKMLSCLLTPTNGDALMLGHSIITETAAVKQKMNISPQETAVAPNLSVKENMEFIANIYGSNKQQGKQKAIEMMTKFGLTEHAKKKAKTLSGGLQRRLSIAMAMISDPEIIFLDEPTLGLDVRARRDLWNVLLALKGHVTIILTTHYLEEVEALADRVGIMHGGKLHALGTVEELKEKTGKATLEDIFLTLTEKEVS